MPTCASTSSIARSATRARAAASASSPAPADERIDKIRNKARKVAPVAHLLERLACLKQRLLGGSELRRGQLDDAGDASARRRQQHAETELRRERLRLREPVAALLEAPVHRPSSASVVSAPISARVLPALACERRRPAPHRLDGDGPVSCSSEHAPQDLSPPMRSVAGVTCIPRAQLRGPPSAGPPSPLQKRRLPSNVRPRASPPIAELLKHADRAPRVAVGRRGGGSSDPCGA